MLAPVESQANPTIINHEIVAILTILNLTVPAAAVINRIYQQNHVIRVIQSDQSVPEAA